MRLQIVVTVALVAGLAVGLVGATEPGVAGAHVTRVITAPTALPPLTVRSFASGATAGLTKPDSIVVTKEHVFIAYQNNTPPDGSVALPSTIVEYTRGGKAVKEFTVIGRCDGMRWNPYTRTLWATVNEDAHPGLFVITPGTGDVKHYTFVWPTRHGGGFDDLAFVNGKAFAAASNPTLNAQGVNTAPAVVSVRLQSNGIAAVAPVLYGNAVVRDTTTGSTVRINAIDPDSLRVAPDGALALVDQAGTEIVFIRNAGLAGQFATRVPVGTQLEDIDWTRSAHGEFFVVDAIKDATYTVEAAAWPIGVVWTEAPNDSGVASWVGTLDLSTGIATPELVGFGSPTGLIWVDDSVPAELP